MFIMNGVEDDDPSVGLQCRACRLGRKKQRNGDVAFALTAVRFRVTDDVFICESRNREVTVR